ncbi:sigma-70 family RNA polymerase sigma factor [uncultured Chitinophaga sp.]|jgi:RNA polymerase sigma factor, sigma-70 family|uniref:RNA polymerase sigma factor n=1 Tax=uncultured Chitinophaga sp. TaxID=339340 RepID=UPI002629BD42|nr:sigma-70 family RNA polymerase sigma factor [uncultured Chitinophaga sp.]
MNYQPMKEGLTHLEASSLQQLQQNSEQALAMLMRHYYADLYNYAARFARDEPLIKDCIQEVFISLWQRRETAGSIFSLRYYLLRAVKNKVLKALYYNDRKTGLANFRDDYDFFHEFSIERIIIERQISEEKAEKLKRTLALLTKRQKEVIYLKFYQHLDHGQIAELMSVSRQSVYNLLHEAIQKLRNLWHTEFITR